MQIRTNLRVEILYGQFAHFLSISGAVVVVGIFALAFRWQLLTEGGMIGLLWLPAIVLWGVALVAIAWFWACLFANANRAMCKCLLFV